MFAWETNNGYQMRGTKRSTKGIIALRKMIANTFLGKNIRAEKNWVLHKVFKMVPYKDL